MLVGRQEKETSIDRRILWDRAQKEQMRDRSVDAWWRRGARLAKALRQEEGTAEEQEV